MTERETDVFYADTVDDGLGAGVRIRTQHDEMYTMRGHDGIETRVYTGDDDRWQVKARVPVEGDEEDGYEEFRDLIYDLADAYDEEVTIPALAFMEGDHERTLAFTPGPVTVRYNAEERVDLSVSLPDERRDWIKGSAVSLATFSGRYTGVVGGGVGGLTGISVGLASLTDPALTLAGAGVLTALAGGGSAVLAALGSAGYWGYKEGYPVWTGEAEDARFESHPGGRTRAWKNRFKEKREQETREQGRSGDLIHDDGFLDLVNERNRLAATVEEADDYALAERFQELDEAGVWQVFDAAMTFQFNQFEDRQGVTLTATATDYAGAVDLVEAITGTEAEGLAEPSIYQDRDAFASLLEDAPEDDAERMVAEAIAEADDAVIDHLDREYADLVERVGKERSLYGAGGVSDARTGH